MILFLIMKDKVKKLQLLTEQFLQKAKKGKIVSDDINDLREVLRFHEYRYYIMNDPLISDFEYDQLYKSLEALEEENPDLITPDSPTQRVGKSLTKDFPTVQHLSLQKKCRNLVRLQVLHFR